MKGNMLTTIITCLEIQCTCNNSLLIFVYKTRDSHEQTHYLQITIVHLIYGFDCGSSPNYPLTVMILKN